MYIRMEMGASWTDNPAQSLHAAVRAGKVKDAVDRRAIRLKGFAHFFTFFAFFSPLPRQAKTGPN